MDIFKRIVLLMVMYAFSAVLVCSQSAHAISASCHLDFCAYRCYAASAILDTIISLKDAENEVNQEIRTSLLTGRAFCLYKENSKIKPFESLCSLIYSDVNKRGRSDKGRVIG